MPDTDSDIRRRADLMARKWQVQVAKSKKAAPDMQRTISIAAADFQWVLEGGDTK